jgi:hypothetical protein
MQPERKGRFEIKTDRLFEAKGASRAWNESIAKLANRAISPQIFDK